MPLTSPDGYLDFTNAVPRAVKMVATSNVGIGTSSPIYALDVHGTSNTGPLTVSSLTLANGAIEGDLNISGNLLYTSNTTTVVNSNVVVEHKGPHRRDPKDVPLKKYPEIVFDASKLDGNDSTNTYVQAGYTVSVSGFVNSSNHPWKAFNGIDFEVGMLLSGLNYDTNGNANTSGTTASRLSASDSTPYGEWLKLELPNKIKLDRYAFTSRNDTTQAIWSQSVEAGQVWGSNNDSDWEHLHTFTDSGFTAGSQTASFVVHTNNYYKYYAFIVTKTFAAGTDYYLCLPELKYYGYEEDPPAGDSSLDATFKSVLNTPQTTGANVYVDAKLSSDFTNQVTGPTPVGTAATHNDTGKYWELTGALTSNVTVEANTFLEGDQPHAVSVWFNSSNLEANTANTCVFTISDQENLDSYNLDLQSNTWHNLTYSYQGEGGSRVTYLDGRKVAEDQAEDTFGDYPPFAMTGYSQGGYVVSASSSYAEGSYPAWEAFNNIWHNNGNTNGSDAWLSENATNYNGVDGLYSKSPPRNLGTGALDGEWLKIEMPHRIKLDYIRIYPRYQHDNKAPRDFIVYGSNDNVNWTAVLTETGASITSSDWESGHAFVADVHDTYYKYFGLVTRKLRSETNFVNIAELRLYGHRENDLVRLPDPTHVLKYPHIAMTGPAQRGYVATASSKVNNNEDYGAWGAFNGNVEKGTLEGWGSEFDTYDNASPSLAVTSGSLATQFNSRYGEYINIKLPHKILLSKIHTFPRAPSSTVRTYEHPDAGYLYGSNDGFSTFQEIYSFDGVTVSSTYGVPVIHTIPSSHLGVNLIAYDEYRFQVTKLKGQNRFAVVSEMELYGTEEATPVPIQIGGGNIDKVANFRVYDTFVEEDQALEIWDAQKDEFGRAKSSMTLHKGRLGIGTEEPEGRLAVLDEPRYPILEEFPPRAMTDHETYIEGHGVFKASASHQYTTTGNGSSFNAFDKNEEEWQTLGGTFSGGALAGSGLTTITNGIGAGVWIQLEMPYKIILKKWDIRQRITQPNRHIKNAFLVGTNDGHEWDIIQTITNATSQTDYHRRYYDLSTNILYYKTFRLVITEINGADRPDIYDISFFGTREQRQSVLHDGQLTLTKSLTVPRIGPALDADDTPRRDRLVVEYNTSTNPTFEGAVRDTSGRGNDGVFYGGASYDATEKALVFDGSDDYIFTGNVNNPAGAWAHSYSFWVNFDGTSSEMLVQFGKEGASKSSSLRLNSSIELIWFFNSYNTKYTCSISTSATTWYHISAVYDGNLGMSVYINGVPLAVASSTLTTPANYDANEPLYIGSRVSKADFLDGSISNFKLYDTALTASEVKTLYDMGRCDEGHHVVNFSKTRVGIGLGDGEPPTYTLDVRGQIRSQGSLVTSFTGQHKCVPEEPVEKGLIVSAKKNRFVKLNGGLDSGKSAITIDESLPVVSLSSVAKDKACFGVVSSMEEANSLVRVETVGGVISDAPKTLGDNRAIVNSVGEGAIWVVNTGGSLESGDYITTSNVVGYGQKQDDDVLHNYTVAKITMDCDFTATEVPLQVIKREETGLRTITEDEWNTLVDYDRSSNTETQYSNTLVPSAYSNLEVTDRSGYVPREVTTIVDYTDGSNLISIAEWSNLESNIQNTYQSNTFTEIVDYIKFVTADEWSNLASNVQNTFSEAEITTYYQIKRGENVLDENGQLQWEDKTGATEAPYERRFLDASGIQTDEANAVHIAAFVGCTYHCG